MTTRSVASTPGAPAKEDGASGEAIGRGVVGMLVGIRTVFFGAKASPVGA
jgi:hypothetical protein